VYGAEAVVRRRAYSQELLGNAMTAVDRRARQTSALLADLGRRQTATATATATTTTAPVVLAYESIQVRYELDDRVVVRSLDGRVDPELLRCVRNGFVDHICYVQRHVDFVMETPAYGARAGEWSLAQLRTLRPGEAVDHGGLRFRRLPALPVFSVEPAGP
jgi:hypothetical protein